jgi:hypothetical protein
MMDEVQNPSNSRRGLFDSIIGTGMVVAIECGTLVERHAIYWCCKKEVAGDGIVL